MNQEVDNDEITIDLAELFGVLLSKPHIILLAGIFMALVAFVGTKLLITPQYTSVTKVYVFNKQSDNTGTTMTDLQTGTLLTKDYMELAKSRPVLEQVIAVLNLDITPSELRDMISVETPADTRILSISVQNPDPKQAKEIADAVRESVCIQITDIMNVDTVNTVEDGNLPTSPSSPNVMKNLVLGGMLGVILAIGIIVLIHILNDTIKTPDDVERHLGLNVLANIPIAEGAKKSKKVKGSRQLIKKMKR